MVSNLKGYLGGKYVLNWMRVSGVKPDRFRYYPLSFLGRTETPVTKTHLSWNCKLQLFKYYYFLQNDILRKPTLILSKVHSFTDPSSIPETSICSSGQLPSSWETEAYRPSKNDPSKLMRIGNSRSQQEESEICAVHVDYRVADSSCWLWLFSWV